MYVRIFFISQESTLLFEMNPRPGLISGELFSEGSLFDPRKALLKALIDLFLTSGILIITQQDTIRSLVEIRLANLFIFIDSIGNTSLPFFFIMCFHLRDSNTFDLLFSYLKTCCLHLSLVFLINIYEI